VPGAGLLWEKLTPGNERTKAEMINVVLFIWLLCDSGYQLDADTRLPSLASTCIGSEIRWI
jgi:hypothetical protein